MFERNKLLKIKQNSWKLTQTNDINVSIRDDKVILFKIKNKIIDGLEFKTKY